MPFLTWRFHVKTGIPVATMRKDGCFWQPILQQNVGDFAKFFWADWGFES